MYMSQRRRRGAPCETLSNITITSISISITIINITTIKTWSNHIDTNIQTLQLVVITTTIIIIIIMNDYYSNQLAKLS